MRKLPPLNAIRAFEAAARHGSFTAAASELCVTVTAISHQVRQLEATVGQKLFERSGRAVVLTEAGQTVFPQLRQGFDQMADAFAAIRPNAEGDIITVSTTRAFAERWLMSRLERFNEAHPSVIVNIDATEEIVDMAASSVDLAIRYGPVSPSDRRNVLFEDSYVAVVSAAISGTEGAIDIDHFHSRPLLAYRWKNRNLESPNWSTWLSSVDHNPDRDFRISWFSEETLALHAAERGIGPLLCSDALVHDELRRGTLVKVAGPTLPGFAYRIVQTPSRLKRKSITAFTDWLHAEAALFRDSAGVMPSQAA